MLTDLKPVATLPCEILMSEKNYMYCDSQCSVAMWQTWWDFWSLLC